MSHLSYLAVLGGCLLASVWLEYALRTRVLRRPLRLLAVLACVVPLFFAWDVFAIAHTHWTFDEDQMLGYRLLADVPLEELLFFVVIPFAAVLTYEAVRSVKPHWSAGDEPSDAEDSREQVQR